MRQAFSCPALSRSDAPSSFRRLGTLVSYRVKRDPSAFIRKAILHMAEAEQNSMLVGIYQGWERYSRLLADAIAPLSDEQFDLRPEPHLRSIRELATHIVATRANWFHKWLSEGGDDMATIARWDREGRTPSAHELVTALDATWRLIRDAISRWTPDDLQEQLVVTRGERTRTLTRPWVTWHVIEHDLHHGGEIGYTLGMHGIAAPDI